MAIEVRKRDRETTPSLLRRFTKRVQQSGVLLEVRTRKFRQKQKTKREKKLSALRREQMKKQIGHLKKIGKFKEFLEKKKRR